MSDTLESVLRSKLSPLGADGLPCSTQLYRYVSGELPPAELAAFKAHLLECQTCQADLHAYQQPKSALHPPGPKPRRGRSAWKFVLIALVLIAAGLGVSRIVFHKPSSSRAVKVGTPRLLLTIRRGEVEFPADEGTAFREGDSLSLFYSATAPVWPLVVFCDDQGNVKQLFPSVPAEQVPMAKRAPLSGGMVLEPAKGREWIVAYFGTQTLPYVALADGLRKAVRVTGSRGELSPPVPADVDVHVTPVVRGNP